MFSLRYSYYIFIPKLIISILITKCQGYINASYDHMPPLYQFDDYNECFQKNNTNFQSIYCMIFMEIIPDNTSVLWQQIEEFSNSYTFHYRHDRLFRGLCLKDTKENLNGNCTNGNFTTSDKELIDFLRQVFSDQLRNINYDDIDTRLNNGFKEEYNISLETMTLYCDSSNFYREKDFGYKITISICIIIILLNVSSSLYDIYLKCQNSTAINNKYYNRRHKSQVSRFLTTFSIYRNFKQFISPNKSITGNDLGFLDGYRTILSFLIVFEHSFYIQFVHLKNPEFFENLYHQYFMIFMLHGLIVVELFFLLSGLMLYIKMDKGQYITKTTSTCKCLKIYGKLLFSRYMRYLPSLGFLILLNANLPLHFQHGPFWRFMMESHCYLCQQYWWKNVLMFNNFDISKSCLGHTWYIAADFQLYAFYLLVLIFVAKHPKYKIWTFTLIATISAIIPILINYLLQLDSIAFMKLESFRYFYLMDIETGKQLYLPSYTNLHGFLTGIVCGELYTKYFRGNHKSMESIGNFLKYSPFIGWPIIGGIFYLGTEILWQKPSLGSAFYGLLQRHICIVIIATTTIILLMSKRGTISKILSSLPFRLLARISYQVYLWHFIIVLIIANYFSQPINVNYYLILIVVVMTYLTANIVALIVALTVEYPLAEIFYILKVK